MRFIDVRPRLRTVNPTTDYGGSSLLQNGSSFSRETWIRRSDSNCYPKVLSMAVCEDPLSSIVLAILFKSRKIPENLTTAHPGV